MGTYTLVGFRPMELMKLEVFCFWFYVSYFLFLPPKR